MFDNLEALFMENVLAAYDEFSRSLRSDTSGRNNDIRLGINAAVALYHLREHFPAAARKTRAQLAAACPDYDILGDVVNSAKHQALTRSTPRVATASDIYEEIAYTLYQDQEGDYWDAEKMVTVKLIDGSMRNLRDILTNVLNMWIDEFHARGALSSLSRVVSPSKGIPQRYSKSGVFGMSLELMIGLRFRHRMRLQKYNYSTGLVEPFRDVKEATFSIYKYKPPSYTMDDIIPRVDDKRFVMVVFIGKLDSQYKDKFKPSAQHAIFFQKRLSKGNVLILEFFLNALCKADLQSARSFNNGFPVIFFFSCTICL